MGAITVELDTDPVVFEIRSTRTNRKKKDVVCHVSGIEDVSNLRVTVQPIPPAGDFHFKAEEAEVMQTSERRVRVAVPVICHGDGKEGAEGKSELILACQYQGEEVKCTVRLVATANCVLPLWQVLAEEYSELKPEWHGEIHDNPELKNREKTDGEKLKAILGIVHGRTKNDDGLTALCFSGGGIRSATFNLGVLQGVARAGLLDKFDYVSSVSGGGYLSSWLAGWLHRDGGVAKVAPLLGHAQADPERPEARPLIFLRQYSNYLTPRLGALSGDTWTIAAIVIRNLLLNLLVMVPLLAALLVLPLLAVAKMEWSPGPEPLFWLAVVTGTTGIFFMSLLRASAKPRLKEDETSWDQRFLLLGLAPLLVGNLFMAWAVAAFEKDRGFVFSVVLQWTGIWAWVMPVVAFGAADLLQSGMLHRKMAFFKSDLISLTLSGGVITFLYAVIVTRWAKPLLDSPYPLYPVLAPILFLGPVMLHKTLFIAFSSFAEERGFPSDLGDADREWWARWSGYTLIAAVLWMVVSAGVFFGPSLLGQARNFIGSRVTTAGLTGFLGWIISRLGQSSNTKAKESGETGGWRSWAMALAAPLFCLAVLLLVSALTQDLLRKVFGAPVDREGWIAPFSGTFVQILGASAVLGLLGLFLGRFVNVNRFSLQAMYRNRLVRAYLGASNPKRRPNLFTGFDPEDNLRMHELRKNRPFPVVNVALNLVSGKDLAWQQRKAESFTASPLHCGAARLGYRRAQAYGGEHGLSLGTAVATSGAAANPNMGYHSSPFVTFIMTLFNARLGIWLGNPGPLGADTYTRSGPRSSGLVLLSEALGHTDSDHPYVNLSDGGHFENLGIYEMVRRRCRYIVVGDGGCDPQCAFDDLGNAIRKIRIDLGVPIEFEDRVDVFPKPTTGKPEANARYCAIGTIRYSAVDGPAAVDGTLIYIKPAIYEGRHEPYDVYNYAKTSKDFPHEPTGDQWFSESQFESYRALGSGAVQSLIGQGPNTDVATLATFEANVRRYLSVGSSRPPRSAAALAAPAAPPMLPPASAEPLLPSVS